jgi:4-amino-4-deoxy-L-arabinose transferase-like glycosyltransferase
MNRRLEALAPVAVLALCALFLFVDPRPLPVQLWDESRIAVNALEMHRRGLSLVSTYGFAPDLWNTKPPLLVWLIAAAMAVFGPTAFAVHLPSALAALGTLAITYAFTRRMTGSAWAGAFAALLLALSVGFFGEHGARTGDYDALLCLFTTAYLVVLFFAVHRRRPAPARLLGAGLLGAGALLTKSIAGAVPAAGLGLYLVAVRRWRRPLASPWYAAALLAGLVPAAAFYLAREAAAPGYLAAVWGNDVSGRFLTALDKHAGGPWYYLWVLFIGLFSASPLALLAPLAIPLTRGKARLGLAFSLCAAAGVVAVVSLASTKLPQYAAPALPFLAMATAIAAHAGMRRLSGVSPWLRRALAAAVVAAIALQAAHFRYGVMAERAFLHQALYGELFANLHRAGQDAVSVVDGGVEAVGVPPGYSPQLRFYTLAWAGRGLTIERAPSLAGATRPVAASCDPDLLPALEALGPDIGGVAGCRAVVTNRR